MHVLVTGASGYLGRYVAGRLSQEHQVSGTYRSAELPISGCRLVQADLNRPEDLREMIQEFCPEVVIHAAAMAGPDACEEHREEAYRVNVSATEAIAHGAADVGARFFYISSDLVFDDSSPPYAEDAQPNPLSYYGETKLDGERVAREAYPHAIVLRLSLTYGWKTRAATLHGSPAFSDAMYQNLSEGKPVRLFSDQIRSAVYVPDAAEMIARLVSLKEDAFSKDRLFHMSGPERISRLEFGETMCRVFDLDSSLLIPTRLADLTLPARRPLNCSLDGRRLYQAVGFTPRSVEAALQDMLLKVP